MTDSTKLVYNLNLLSLSTPLDWIVVLRMYHAFTRVVLKRYSRDAALDVSAVVS